MTLTRMTSVFALTLGLAIMAPASAAESSILINQQTALCAYPASIATGAYLQQATCSGDTDQMWQGELVARLSNSAVYMRLRNKLTGLCADLESASTLAGVRVVQAPCSTSTTQQWTTPAYAVTSVPTVIGPSAQTFIGMTNRFSGKCLEAPADTTPLRQNTCGSSGYLKWFYVL